MNQIFYFIVIVETIFFNLSPPGKGNQKFQLKTIHNLNLSPLIVYRILSPRLFKNEKNILNHI